MKGVVRFGKKGKLSPSNVVPYEILQKVGKVASELKLPSELASVHPIFHVLCLKSEFVIPSLFFLLRVLVSRITSLLRMFQFKFFIGKSRSSGIKRWFL